MASASFLKAVSWIEGSIHLAYRCADAQAACEQYSAVVNAGAVRALEIIGEAVTSLPRSVRKLLPGIALERYAGMRIKLAHKYFEVDMDIVWDTIANDLPVLEAALPELRALLQRMEMQ